MFKVKVIKKIHSCFAGSSSNDINLVYWLRLPFVPYVGLSILDGDWEGVLVEVHWKHDNKMFSCYVESDKTLYNADLKHEIPIKTIEEIVQEWVRDGWQREERI